MLFSTCSCLGTASSPTLHIINQPGSYNIMSTSSIKPITRDSLQTHSSSCAICERIVALFTPCKPRSVGKISSLLEERSCPHHIKFFKAMKFRGGELISDYGEHELSVMHWMRASCILFGIPHLGFYTGPVELVHRPDLQCHHGKALLVDPQWIDEGVVKNWIRTCDEDHGVLCSHSSVSNEEGIQPLYLIDTMNDCIVRSSNSTRKYVALSYVWGQTQSLRNNSKLCQKLQQRNILSSSEFSHLIPTTIKDAIRIVRFLGKRYLWVDALCIVQDDKQLLESELSRMHLIYAYASITIIAAVGEDANHGLRGFKKLTAPRNIRQDIIQLGGSERIILKNSIHAMNFPTSYYKRGWTFQELIFSRRRLIFKNEGIQWQCQCNSTWYEDLIPRLEMERISNDHDNLFYETVPRLSIMANTMMEFNDMAFTFPEDAVPAFQGIQSILHRTFPGGLIYGHPEFFFDITLTWTCLDDVNRRVSPAEKQQLPSWSWLGWQGRVRFPYDREVSEVWESVIQIEGYKTPATEWYTARSLQRTEKRRINSAWHDYKIRAQEDHSVIPPGWRRENFEPGNDLDGVMLHAPIYKFLGGTPRYHFKHPDLKYIFEEASQWYPVPVLERSCSEPRIQPQTSFLFAKTSRAHLFVNTTTDFEPLGIPQRLKRRGPPHVRLNDRSSNFVGYLQLHHENDIAEFQNEIDSSGGKRVELVATCLGYTGKIFDYELAESIKEETGAKEWAPQLKNCYFVLWIEWEDGVAYRRGTGAVTEEAWESERESKLVDLVLG